MMSKIRTKRWTRDSHTGMPVLNMYEIGDRVVLQYDLHGILAGTEGVVVKGSSSEYYAVLLDGTNCPRGLYPEQIAPAGLG